MAWLSRRTWRALAVTLVALAALAAGVFGYGLLRPKDDRAEAVAALRQLRLPDLEGRPRSMTEWQGRVIVVNFWATWCEPCRKEVPALVKVRDRYQPRLEIVGLSIDSADKVKTFAEEFRISYPLLLAGLESVDLSRRLGNRVGALPYTVILDRSGKLVLTHLGGLDEHQLEEALAPIVEGG